MNLDDSLTINNGWIPLELIDDEILLGEMDMRTISSKGYEFIYATQKIAQNIIVEHGLIPSEWIEDSHDKEIYDIYCIAGGKNFVVVGKEVAKLFLQEKRTGENDPDTQICLDYDILDDFL